MSDCRICLKAGQQRNGGDLGLCRRCADRPCRGCGAASAGLPYCTECEHGADIVRWKARANHRAFDLEREEEFYAARREKLMQSKFHFHEAVEVLFRGFFYALEALWGLPPRRIDERVEPALQKPVERHEGREAA